MGQGWAGVGWALADAFGVTGLIESGTGKDSWTGEELSDYQRTKRGTEGGITVLLTLLGARGARGPKRLPMNVRSQKIRLKITRTVKKVKTSKPVQTVKKYNKQLENFGSSNRQTMRGSNDLNPTWRESTFRKVYDGFGGLEQSSFSFFRGIDKTVNTLFTKPVTNTISGIVKTPKMVQNVFKPKVKPKPQPKAKSQPHGEFEDQSNEQSKILWEQQKRSEVKNLASNLYNKAKQEVGKLTKLLQEISGTISAEVVGLENALKSIDSLERKIYDRINNRDMKYGYIEAIRRSASKINDSMRFTLLLAPENYSSSFYRVKSLLEANGYKYKKSYNAWREGDGTYKGVNSTFETPSGLEFEVQFHTRETFDIKQKTHYLYEESRSTGISKSRKEQIATEQRLHYIKIETPVGASDIK